MASNALINNTNQLRPDCTPLQTHHVPRIKPEELNACNVLYRCPPIAAKNLIWKWHINRDRKPMYSARLSAGSNRLRIELGADIVGLDNEPLEWIQYKGETRLLAWTHAHEQFLRLLQVVFGCDWMLDEINQIASSAITIAQNEVKMGFAVHHKKGELVATGDAIFPLAWAGKLSVRQHSNLDQKRGFNQIWRHTPIQLPWLIDSVDVSKAQLHSIVKGSLIRLDNSTLKERSAKVTLLLGNNTLLGELNDSRIHVVAMNSSFDWTHEIDTPLGDITLMNIDNDEFKSSSEKVETLTDFHPTNLPADAIPITLHFEAGQIKLMLSELSRVQPGYVFELDKKLEDRFINVYANGYPIARGQLVVVNDFIGVRITEVTPQ